MIKIGVLTSSRADYGIYKPLLEEIKTDNRFYLEIISFGMHLLNDHGKTINEIKKDKFRKIIEIEGMSNKDSQIDIVNSYGNLILNFSNFWNNNIYDFVFCLGDRFEMSAAVQSGIPYEIKFVHFHGGEISEGSIDDIYRNQISLASRLHFVASLKNKRKLTKLLGSKDNIFNVGSLSLSKIDSITIPDWKNVCADFKINNKTFVLVTFHPETVGLGKNKIYIKIIKNILIELSNHINIIITQSNADGGGSLYRDMFKKLSIQFKNKIDLVDSFGKYNYFSALNNCKFLLGNSSSGIIEAASFKKMVINVGDRQKGRFRDKNIIDVEYNYKKILDQCVKLASNKNSNYLGKNMYHKKHTIKNVIKQLFINE
jgi:GDP/UDP-N,N'-diacetylbacillosamine 2-epimerase (hydrolysing)